MQTISSSDCGYPMCDVCTATNPSFPCVGVLGSANTLQTGQATPPANTDTIWTYGNKTSVPYLWSLGTDTTKQCSSASGLGLYDITGTCIPSFGINNANLTQKTPLLVNHDTFDNLINGKSSVSDFPLQGVHKVWGDGGGTYNKGVNSKNVYLNPNQETVSCKVGDSTFSMLQSVLVMEAHGDLYTGKVPGLEADGKKNASCFNSTNSSFYTGDVKTCAPGDNVMPQCKNWTELDPSVPSNNTRVGGVACTRGQYGPGVYNLLCYIPKTEDTSNDGRGYVFAIWPFHYEEIYTGQQKVDAIKAPCFEECDGMTPIEATCPASQGCKPNLSSNTLAAGAPVTNDYFSAMNHEIDIEIPTNSPQLDWKTQMTWDTMNCNTWLNDINNYDQNTGAYYSQVAVKNPNGNFISSEPEGSDKKDYHWYTLDWKVDPGGDLSKNYVAFYFDDPFDPAGNTHIGSFSDVLPTQPRGTPLFKTNRFIPTRSGRLNFGPWMAWWGYGAKSGLSPNFDTAKIRMAQLSITPYPDLWDNTGKYLLPDFPQNYDQPGAVCDFRDLVQPLTPPPAPPSTTVTSKGLPIWVIVLIIVGIIVLGLVIYAIVDGVKRKKKAKAKAKAL